MIKTLFVLGISVLRVNADNTPNLCTDDIVDLLKVKPSEANPGFPIPSITVGGSEYDGDADHFVIGNSKATNKNMALIYIPGTTDRPELSSCLLKSVSAHLKYPTIGLSYSYLSSGDSFRNGKCALEGTVSGLPEQVNCLTQQHEDAINGGTYGLTHFKDGNPFWAGVEPRDSITARIGFLLKFLDTTYPEAGWGRLYTDASPFPTPKWDRLIFMGHSQGAGHAAYLAQTKRTKGTVMVSGPQDQCTDCPAGTEFWMDKPYLTSKSTAFASGDEPLIGIMKDNWSRMTKSGGSTWKMGEVADVGFATDRSKVEVCDSPVVSTVKFAPTSTCGGKEHCSTAIDDSVPFIEKSNGEKKYLYEVFVWPDISRNVKLCRKRVFSS